MDKKRIFSGIQPSGAMTIGNYLGAMKNWAALQDEYDCCYAVVDMHAITVRQQPKDLRANSLSLLALFMACGIDAEKQLLFFQSHVPQHAQLAWALNCYTYMGELSRMTQFKDKSRKHEENINAGLFTYPVLMAADILLYQADLVPVGEDQRQHLELTRDIAVRFNSAYGDTFKVPEGFIPKAGARVMSLQDPTQKMSKSDDNANAYVLLLDPPETIIKKFKRAVTDSGAEVRRGEGKAGIENLMSIYSAVTGKTFDDIESDFEGKGYGDFKTAVGESVVDAIAPIQEKFNDLMKNKDHLENLYKKNAETARYIANKTVNKVYKKIGFIL